MTARSRYASAHKPRSAETDVFAAETELDIACCSMGFVSRSAEHEATCAVALACDESPAS
jgi:hypothetical protein